jgi:hypothetical protein
MYFLMLQQLVRIVFSWFQMVNIKPNLKGFIFWLSRQNLPNLGRHLQNTFLHCCENLKFHMASYVSN